MIINKGFFLNVVVNTFMSSLLCCTICKQVCVCTLYEPLNNMTVFTILDVVQCCEDVKDFRFLS